jgi:hypothetical protein
LEYLRKACLLTMLIVICVIILFAPAMLAFLIFEGVVSIIIGLIVGVILMFAFLFWSADMYEDSI